MNYTIKDIKDYYIQDTIYKPNHKIGNITIIKLCDYIINNIIDATDKIIINNNTYCLNRGDIAECLIKMLFINSDFYQTSAKNKADLIYNNITYEIKNISMNYANYNQNQNITNLLVLDNDGLYYSNNGENVIILNKDKTRIKDIDKNHSSVIKLLDL